MKLILAGVGCLLAAAVAAVIAPGQAPRAAAASAHTVDVRLVATATYEATTDTPLATKADGDLPVARTAAGEQARSVISIDAPASATAGRITIAVQTRADQEYGSPEISACPVTATWQPGTGQALAAAPAYTCAGVKPVAVTATTVSFDLAPALSYWRAGHPEFGVALVMDAAATVPEKAVLNAVASQVVGSATVPVSASGGATAPGGSPATAAAPAPAVPLPGPAAPALPNLAPGAPVTSVVPAVPPVVAPSLRPTPVAAAGSASLPVPGAVWFLVPGGLLLLAGIGRSLSGAGDPPLPLPQPVAAGTPAVVRP